MALLDWIPSIVDAVGSFLGFESNKNTNSANAQMVADTNANNLAIAQQTNAMNQAINERNIQLTREQNAINRAREDDAVRRRVNDLVGAGLSKTLAAGSAASANAMQAPQAEQAMVTGHEMKSATRKAYDWASASYNIARTAQDAIIAKKEYDLKNRDLDLEQQRLDEEIRHNKEMEGQGSRNLDISEAYLDNDKYWKEQYYDQNAEFHRDAVRLEEASQSLEERRIVSQESLNKMQEAWYQAEIDFKKVTSEQNAMRLTSDIAVASARVAESISNVELNSKQRQYADQMIRYYAEVTAEAVARKRQLNAETRQILVDTLVKCYNLGVAKSEGTTTTSSIPSATEVEQLKKTRISNYVTKGVGNALTLGAGIFLGSGGGKFIQKALGWDDFTVRGLENR